MIVSSKVKVKTWPTLKIIPLFLTKVGHVNNSSLLCAELSPL